MDEHEPLAPNQLTDPAHLMAALIDIQIDSVRALAVCVGLIGYAWLGLNVWPYTGYEAPLFAWIGSGLLIVCAILSYWQGLRWIRGAKHMLIWGVIAAVTCAALAWPAPAMLNLFSVPVIFAGVLLSRKGIVFATLACFFAIPLVVYSHGGPGEDHLGLLIFPILIVGLSSFSVALSTQNLYLALTWFTGAYIRAYQNERLATERQAELRRVLKALDESNYRVERANAMLTFARNQAEEARTLKQQFVQNISHELRTPLNLIVGFSELMVKSPEFYNCALPPMVFRDLSIVYRNATHLQTLVNDVLDLARVESAQMRFYPQELEPGELVVEAVEMMRGLVESRGLGIRTDLSPNLPRISVDPIRVRQVIFNLLNNAARFTEEGELVVRAIQTGQEIVISVQDTGPGIAQEELPRIFEEFYQADGSTRRRHGGIGLGLAISRQFVRLHGGRIWAESVVGEGSTFSFTLPLESILLNANGNHPTPVLPHSFGMQPACMVLVITQSILAIPVLHSYLGEYRMMIAGDLEQGRALAQQMLPQLVLIDLTTCSLTADGIESVAQAWRLASIPFVGIALPGAKDPVDSMIDGYLVKPVTRQELLDTLRGLGSEIDRILLIDDDRQFVRMMQRMLQSSARRYQVVGAHSGEEGLALVEHIQPHLVLLDMVLPDMTGRQIVARLRSLPDVRQPKVFVVSAQDEIDYGGLECGPIVIAKGNGFVPTESLRWVKELIVSTRRSSGTQSFVALADGASR